MNKIQENGGHDIYEKRCISRIRNGKRQLDSFPVCTFSEQADQSFYIIQRN